MEYGDLALMIVQPTDHVQGPRRIPLALEFAQSFHAYSPWSEVPFDAAACALGLARLDSTGHLDVREGGMIGGMIVPCLFNPAIKMAAELFWWSEDASLGRALREGFEAWARDQGALYVMCSALADEHEPAVRRLYGRAGYEAAEIAFRKVL